MKGCLSFAMMVCLSGAALQTADARERCSYGADLNLDGEINFEDLLELLFHWGHCHVWNPDTSEWEDCPTQEDCDCAADLNNDETVSFHDMLLMLTKWGPVEECPECDDAIDNDGDGLTDEFDPGCWQIPALPFTYDPERNDESAATTQCQDGVDNDNDGLADFPDDPGCGHRFINTEVERVDPLRRPACRDGLDNDNDGLTDWGLDPTLNDSFCSSPFDESEQDVLLDYISWELFPDFQLNDNLTVIYGGLNLGPSQYYPERPEYGLIPLSRGFSHIQGSLVTEAHRDELPFQRRVATWNPPGDWRDRPINYEPWAQIRSPWNNDMQILTEHWQQNMERIADAFSDSRGTGVPRVQYLVADIEKRWVSDEQMIANRDDERIPLGYRGLPENLYIQFYKRDMTALYDLAVSYPKEQSGTPALISSYSEAPISNATFSRVGIPRYSWEQWTSDRFLTDYIMQNYEGGGGFGHFFESTLDFLTPSGYFFYDYPRTYEGHEDEWRSRGGFLSRNLFMIDANQVWAPDKKIIQFQWMRLHGAGNCPHCGIPPYMAHLAAIMPFFSENVGIWIWDSDTYHKANPSHPDVTDEHQSQNRHAYNNLVYGLYRLSEYNDYFDEGYQVYHPANARDLHAGKMPVWRGVFSADARRMLIVATNPYAAPGETTEHVIQIGEHFVDIVETTGFNVFLGECDIINGGCVGDEGLDGV